MPAYDDPWRAMRGTPLTPRQQDVLLALARTGSRDAAGRRLGITESTVKAHLDAAYRKLDVEESISAFRTLGWLRPPEDN